MDLFVRTYVEPGYQKIPKVRLTDEELRKALERFVPMCTDAFIVNCSQRLFYLARRKIKPVPGWWCIGGSMFPFETAEDSIMRCFGREAGLALPPQRFKLVGIIDHLCKDREQPPQDVGVHTCSFTYLVELNPMELAHASKSLEKAEYQGEAGLVLFDRHKMVAENVRSIILDLYDHVFPS